MHQEATLKLTTGSFGHAIKPRFLEILEREMKLIGAEELTLTLEFFETGMEFKAGEVVPEILVRLKTLGFPRCSSDVDLSKVATDKLVMELVQRHGVEEHWVKSSEPYAVVVGGGREQNLGPARILVLAE